MSSGLRPSGRCGHEEAVLRCRRPRRTDRTLPDSIRRDGTEDIRGRRKSPSANVAKLTGNFLITKGQFEPPGFKLPHGFEDNPHDSRAVK